VQGSRSCAEDNVDEIMRTRAVNSRAILRTRTSNVRGLSEELRNVYEISFMCQS
jgi:hypothetical protein